MRNNKVILQNAIYLTAATAGPMFGRRGRVNVILASNMSNKGPQSQYCVPY